MNPYSALRPTTPRHCQRSGKDAVFAQLPEAHLDSGCPLLVAASISHSRWGRVYHHSGYGSLHRRQDIPNRLARDVFVDARKDDEFVLGSSMLQTGFGKREGWLSYRLRGPCESICSPLPVPASSSLLGSLFCTSRYRRIPPIRSACATALQSTSSRLMNAFSAHLYLRDFNQGNIFVS